MLRKAPKAPPRRKVRGAARSWLHDLVWLLQSVPGWEDEMPCTWLLELVLQAGGNARLSAERLATADPDTKVLLEIEGGAEGPFPFPSRIRRVNPSGGHDWVKPSSPQELSPGGQAAVELCGSEALRRLRARLKPQLWRWHDPDAALRKKLLKRYKRTLPLPESLMPRCEFSWAWSPRRKALVPGLTDMSQLVGLLSDWWSEMAMGVHTDFDDLPRTQEARRFFWSGPWDQVTIALASDPWKGTISPETFLWMNRTQPEEMVRFPPVEPRVIYRHCSNMDSDIWQEGELGSMMGRSLETCARAMGDLKGYGNRPAGIGTWLRDSSQSCPREWEEFEDATGLDNGSSALSTRVRMHSEVRVTMNIPRVFLYRRWLRKRWGNAAPSSPGKAAAEPQGRVPPDKVPPPRKHPRSKKVSRT